MYINMCTKKIQIRLVEENSQFSLFNLGSHADGMKGMEGKESQMGPHRQDPAKEKVMKYHKGGEKNLLQARFGAKKNSAEM